MLTRAPRSLPQDQFASRMPQLNEKFALSLGTCRHCTTTIHVGVHKLRAPSAGPRKPVDSENSSRTEGLWLAAGGTIGPTAQRRLGRML